MEHSFSKEIIDILNNHFDDDGEEIFEKNDLLKYINRKTKSADKGSKSRGSFGNLYAIYVLVEDYIKEGFLDENDYGKYDGATFSDLFQRQRELSFGAKLQNHALNHRMNREFAKYYSDSEYTPIIRDTTTSKYWFNENLLFVSHNGTKINIAKAIIDIIDKYIEVKQAMLNSFLDSFEELKSIDEEDSEEKFDFIEKQLEPQVDARLFEIVSYAILKYYYHETEVYIGYSMEDLEIHNLILYKTGRTNANDGGIDFVMKPLGRFFQVTETTDVRKYFLDIDKVQRFPITFVVKSEEDIEKLKNRIEEKARKKYPIDRIVEKYLDAVEEIINIPKLKVRLRAAVEDGHLNKIIDEIILQAKVEFNYEEEEEE